MKTNADDFSQVGTLEFRGDKYEIEVMVENNSTLFIQVENCETLDHWTGEYDCAYIEELTHKTGNFKQFSIFCSMLDSAVLQNSESVIIDLLTYEDLKILREQKFGTAKQKRRHKNTDEKLQRKRYLIMTYTVEFDQIHYPLPLTYAGTADPITLKNQVRELKFEIQMLKRDKGPEMDNQEYDSLLVENKNLRSELNVATSQIKEIGSGNLSKELKVLKKVVQNLENDLVKERSKNQRLMAKKKKEYNDLMEEFEELKSNERNYRVRCKSLTEELAMLKRNSRLSPMVNKKTSRQTTYSPNTNARNYVRSNGRNNTNISNRGRSKTRSVSRERERSISASSFGRTPSPNLRRFDPSAYIKERDKKRQELEINRSRRRTPSSNTKRSQTPSGFRYYTKPPSGGGRSSSAKRRNFRSSSVESDADSVSRMRQRKPVSAKKNIKHRFKSRSDTSDEEPYRAKKIPKSRVTPSAKSPLERYKGLEVNEDNENHSIGIAEIDARLEALQKFMKDNMD